MQDLLDQGARNIIITSGTLAPMPAFAAEMAMCVVGYIQILFFHFVRANVGECGGKGAGGTRTIIIISGTLDPIPAFAAEMAMRVTGYIQMF